MFHTLIKLPFYNLATLMILFLISRSLRNSQALGISCAESRFRALVLLCFVLKFPPLIVFEFRFESSDLDTIKRENISNYRK